MRSPCHEITQLHTHTNTHPDTGLNKHLPALSDHSSIVAVCLALSLAQLHSLITHPLIGQDVDKAFKPLNPCCINMSNMHIVNVLILSLRWSTCMLRLAFESGCLGVSWNVNGKRRNWSIWLLVEEEVEEERRMMLAAEVTFFFFFFCWTHVKLLSILCSSNSTNLSGGVRHFLKLNYSWLKKQFSIVCC